MFEDLNPIPLHPLNFSLIFLPLLYNTIFLLLLKAIPSIIIKVAKGMTSNILFITLCF